MFDKLPSHRIWGRNFLCPLIPKPTYRVLMAHLLPRSFVLLSSLLSPHPNSSFSYKKFEIAFLCSKKLNLSHPTFF